MRVLVVEDSPTQVEELRGIFDEVGFEVLAAPCLKDALRLLAGGTYDVILLDLGLPDESGLRVVTRVRAAAGNTPIVVLTGLQDENTALRALREGAQDYLFKNRVDSELVVRSIRYAIERAQTGRALAESRNDLLSILNQLRTGTVLTDPLGRVTFVSKACRRLLGAADEELIGQDWRTVFPLSDQDAALISEMMERPAAERGKVPVCFESSNARRYSVDVEVHDHPTDAQRKMFHLYDMTEVSDLRRLLEGQFQFESLVGRSPAMLAVYDLIRKVATVDITVLVEGETGTGKELVARAIHALSPRRNKPFVAVNCAGLTESLLTSQLFGHRRGAFTGAIEDHLGYFETASGGTLFLDEIGGIPDTVQSSLLRVLQEREIVRLGESKPRKIDIRVLAATSRNLNREVEAGQFRADLMYRIRVARIELPPLRERRQDIGALIAHFLREFRAATGKPVEQVSERAMRRLTDYDWPGNVRELRSAVEFAAVRCQGALVDVDDLPAEILVAEPRRARPVAPAPRGPLAPSEGVDRERQRILDALAQAGGNRSRAARLLGIGRATFYRRLEALNIRIEGGDS